MLVGGRKATPEVTFRFYTDRLSPAALDAIAHAEAVFVAEDLKTIVCRTRGEVERRFQALPRKKRQTRERKTG